MSRTLAYHRPTTTEEALSLLSSAGIDDAPRVVLAGGTGVNTSHQAQEVVDLQALGLGSITDEGDSAVIGAMVRLQDVADSDAVPDGLREAARAEQPSTLRTVATIGGTVASRNGESRLLATLLALGAEITLAGADGERATPIADYLAGDATTEIITAVTVATNADLAAATTGRTPADVPIVAAVGCACDGELSVALTGVAATPVLVDPSDATAGLDPPGDFRGSPDYRRSLATTLTARVVEALS